MEKPVLGQRSTLKKKTADLGELKLEPAVWSCDTGQRIPCSDRCQLIKRWMSNIKDVCCKLNLVPRSHSVTGNVRSGKVRQYAIFHWPLKKRCGNAIYAPIGLFRGALSEGLVFASS